MNEHWKERCEQLRQERINELKAEIAELEAEISRNHLNNTIAIRPPEYHTVYYGCPNAPFIFDFKKETTTFPTYFDPMANVTTLPKYVITKGGVTGPLASINLCPECENALDNFIVKNIYLIIGPSGSGKTTIANELEKRYGLKQIQSYTTRPPRYEGERGHIFVSDEEFDTLGELTAYTEFNGYRYGVTDKEIDESDIYVIDPDGAKYMAEQYNGNKMFYAIRLDIRPRYCYQRMLERGDTHEEAVKRIEHDLKVFSHDRDDICYDLVLPNKNLELSIMCIWAFIQCCESKYEQSTT